MAVETCDRQTWERLAAQSAPVVYGEAGWFEAACAALDLEPRYLVVEERGSPVVRCALAARSRWGRKLLVTPALAAYAGWAESFAADLAPERVELRRNEALGEIGAWCEISAAYARIVLPPEVADVRPFLWRGWRTEQRYTYRFNVAAAREPDLRTNARRNADRAREVGLRASIPTGDDAVAALDACVRATFARQNEPLPIETARWRNYLKALVALPHVRVFAATDGTNVHAAVAVGSDARWSYELLAGTSDSGLANGAGVLALVAAMHGAAEGGVGFDFAGANMPSVAHFKRGFGGRLVPYVAVSWASGPATRWLAENGPRMKRTIFRAVQR